MRDLKARVYGPLSLTKAAFGQNQHSPCSGRSNPQQARPGQRVGVPKNGARPPAQNAQAARVAVFERERQSRLRLRAFAPFRQALVSLCMAAKQVPFLCFTIGSAMWLASV